MRTVPERSRAPFFVTFRDENGELVIPTTARYRVHDEAAGTELIAWTSITPAARVTVSVAASANRILTDANTREVKVLTVQSDESTDNQRSKQHRYQVVNLSGFTS